MRPRARFSTFAVFLALLLCVGTVAVSAYVAPSQPVAGASLSGLIPTPAPGPAQLLRSAHWSHSSVLVRGFVCTFARPVLDARPNSISEPVRPFCVARSSTCSGVFAGRSPPCFS